jgi:hypothetical protein
MLPTINARGDLILVWKLPWRSNLRAGDVVVARSPTDPKQIICKRVIGKGGDLVYVKDTLFADYRAIQIPKGYVWVQGDNLQNSADSRSYGPIPEALVEGKALARLFPEPTWLTRTLKWSKQDEYRAAAEAEFSSPESIERVQHAHERVLPLLLHSEESASASDEASVQIPILRKLAPAGTTIEIHEITPSKRRKKPQIRKEPSDQLQSNEEHEALPSTLVPPDSKKVSPHVASV